jgi:hypothetical protein
MQARITIDGTDAEAAALWDWLRREPELRGHLHAGSTPLPETMGTGTEVVVQVAATLAGAGAIWSALSRSLTAWLTQRRSDLRITVTGSDGRKVTLTASRVADAEAILRQVLPPETPVTRPEQPATRPEQPVTRPAQSQTRPDDEQRGDPAS